MISEVAIVSDNCQTKLSLQQQERWRSGRANSYAIRNAKFAQVFGSAEINALLNDDGTVF